MLAVCNNDAGKRVMIDDPRPPQFAFVGSRRLTLSCSDRSAVQLCKICTSIPVERSMTPAVSGVTSLVKPLKRL